MAVILPQEPSEEDVKLKLITPSLEKSGWSKDDITMETSVKFTDGKVNLQGNMVYRSKCRRADYVLYYERNHPIAIVEAKDGKHAPGHGLQQAMEYAKQLDIPFAYSSNGEAFVEHDFLTGKERTLAMDQFPTQQELRSRYLHDSHDGQGLSSEEIALIRQPYYASQGTHSPRYYQRIVVNRTLGAIARGQQRILLAMATGTGKTYTAFQIVYRLLKSQFKRKILYLADRNHLVDQSIQQDFAPLQKSIVKIGEGNNKRHKAILDASEVYFSLYQQLVGKDGERHYEKLFSPDYFDLVIVDECHRGSAKDDSQWRDILEYFSSATQIGMTATPKETRYQSNLTYFGEPLYSYSLRQGIDDGFLAPFRVVNVQTNISDGWRPCAGQTDYFGNEIEGRIYNNNDYDYNIVLLDRIRAVAHEISEFLRLNGRMQRTIVFCADEDSAERMRQALVNENADMVKKNPDYVVRITGSDTVGKSKLSNFCSIKDPYPVIATTSQLLSTGMDTKLARLIVLDKNISSMTEFKQIMGRGTRLNEEKGKLYFTLMDFRGVSRLFADPDWDGPLLVDPNYGLPHVGEEMAHYGPCPVCGQDPCVCPAPEKMPKPFVDRDGCPVSVTHKVVSIYDTDGKLLRTENIVDYTRRNIRQRFADLAAFVSHWNQTAYKSEVKELFRQNGIDLAQLKHDQGMDEVDDFDFICHLAYNRKPLTRSERAKAVLKRDPFSTYGPEARHVLELLLEKYMNEGIYEIEQPLVLTLDPFRQMGTPTKITRLFGSQEKYKEAVIELKKQLYAV